MRPSKLAPLLVCVCACTAPTPPPQPQQVDAEPSSEATPPNSAKPTEVVEAKPPIEPPPPPVEEPKSPPPEVAPEEPKPPATPAERWSAGVHFVPTPPAASSVIARLPAARAIALVEGDDALELVAVGPSGWRLELAHGAIREASFDPASGLVIFVKDDSIWAIDLLEPLATPDAPPPAVELAKFPTVPTDPPNLRPSDIILCVPPESSAPMRHPTCWPREPDVTDAEPEPEYVSINWANKPNVLWHVILTQFDDDRETYESLEAVDVKLLAADWLRARNDRRDHFAPGHDHGLYDATPLAGIPDFSKHCEDAEDCGKSLPLGSSGWEWVVVGSSRGDLYHPLIAVYNPSTKLWTSWESVVESVPKWIPSSELEPVLDEMRGEHYVLFDATGRVFRGSYSQKTVCQFRFNDDPHYAMGVDCEPVGGLVKDFVSGTVWLGEW